MSTIAIASNEADTRAAQAIEEHHAELAGQLELHVQGLLSAVRRGGQARIADARDTLVAWCRDELEPHAAAEEEILYAAARELEGLEVLVRSMSHEHGLLQSLIAQLAASDDPATLAADAGALRTLLGSHVAKENELVVPALAAAPDVSLADLLDGMHEQLSAEDVIAQDESAPAAEVSSAGGHQCGCHETDDEIPELDARIVPHAIRHATIFGALDAVKPGAAMVLVAPHDPLPLLAQIEDRTPGAYEVTYLERGPEAWRLRFARRAS